jgi:hypothetical protein
MRALAANTWAFFVFGSPVERGDRRLHGSHMFKAQPPMG